MRQKMDEILTSTLTTTFWCLAYNAPASINAPLVAYMEEHIEAAAAIIEAKSYYLQHSPGNRG